MIVDKYLGTHYPHTPRSVIFWYSAMVVCDSLINKGIGKINYNGWNLKDVTVSTYYSIRTVTVESWSSPQLLRCPRSSLHGLVIATLSRLRTTGWYMTNGKHIAKNQYARKLKCFVRVLPLTMEVWFAFISGSEFWSDSCRINRIKT